MFLPRFTEARVGQSRATHSKTGLQWNGAGIHPVSVMIHPLRDLGVVNSEVPLQEFRIQNKEKLKLPLEQNVRVFTLYTIKGSRNETTCYCSL